MADSKIIIIRASPEDVRQRQVIVKVDGEWTGDLMYGEKLTRTVAPGKHTLNFNNTWNRKTVEVNLAPGEEATFRVVNRAGRFTWFLVAAIGAGPMYVSVEREPDGKAP